MDSVLGGKRAVWYYHDYTKEIIKSRNSSTPTDRHDVQLTCAIISAVLTLPAFANIFIIYAIKTTPSLHKPSFLLIANLAVSDLGLALFAQPVSLAGQILDYLGNYEAALKLMEPALVISFFFSGSSVFTLSAISVDRYLAVRLKLQYGSTVTINRVIGNILLIWTIALFNAMGVLYLGHDLTSAINTAGLLLSNGTMFVLYYKSHQLLQKQFTRVTNQADRNNVNKNEMTSNLNLFRFRNTLTTMIIVVICLIICYIPITYVMFRMAIYLKFDRATIIMYFITCNVNHFNSSLNPIILLIRMKPIQNAVFQILRTIANLTK